MDNFVNNVYKETIDACIRYLKRGQVRVPEDLAAGDLLKAHPSLVIHLKLLFCVICKHGYVSDKFGSGLIISLIKDKPGNDIDNYK